MAKRKRKFSPASTAVIDVTPAAPLSMWSGYAGAALSSDRAQLWWPTLDTREEIDSFSRDELMRRIRWLCANEGFIRGLIRNSATLVGYQTPQASSGDEAWDELAEQSFRDSCLTPEVFDHAGKHDFYDAQIMLKRCRYRDGDCFTVLTEWENGRAKVAFYEAHQLRNPDRPPESQRWKDGVLLGQGGRHLAYGFYDPDTKKVTVIPARDVIYSGTFDSPGHVRAVPPLAHGVNHAIDVTEVWANYKKAIKVSSLFGAVREMDAGSTPRSRMGLAGPASTAETNTAGVNVETSVVYGGGQIPRLDPGEKLKTLQDERPHPNVAEFVSTLIRDISTGFGDLSIEVIWEMGRLTGPGVRFVLDKADRWIKDQQRIDRRWCKRVWVYYIAKEIKAGRLPMPKGKDGKPARWWNVSFTSQRNLTIDRTKESRSRLDEIDAGVGTWSGWDDVDGTHWKDRTRQRIREVKFALAECAAEGVPIEMVVKPRQGTAAPAADPSANDTVPTDSTQP